MPTLPYLEAPEVADVQRQVVLWRQEQAVKAGLSWLEARVWADSDGDVGELRRLVEAGCPVSLLARLVL